MEKLKNKGTYKYIYHISDVHIENVSDRFDEYKSIFEKLHNVIQTEKKEECLLCIVGDLIDFKDNITIQGVDMLVYFLKFFGDVCDVVIISGNHDSNIHNVNDADLIECVYNKIETIYDIYYLKKTGLYKINNIVFSVSSIFDRKIINIKKLKNKNDVFVALHHGFVIDDKCDVDKLPYDMSETKFFRAGDFEDYDMVLLGDIHKHMFINYNIAYCSSLIQRNYGESVRNHGYIKWDISKRKGVFSEIKSDYARVSVTCKNGIFCDMPKDLPPNISFKIKLDDIQKPLISKDVDQLMKQYNVKNVKYEEKITKFKVKTMAGSEIEVFDMTNKITMNQIMEDYIVNVLNIDKKSSKYKQIASIHDMYFEETHIDTRNKKKINFKKMIFSNLCSYGSNNVVNFDMNGENILIKGKNGYGKSAILDIICFVLYDKTLRYGNSKIDILNTTKVKGNVTLTFEICGNIYEITKELNILPKKQSILAHLTKNSKPINLSKSEIDDYICDLLGLQYEEFVFLCTMPKNSRNEFLDRSNAEKKELISKLLNMEYLTNIEKKVKNELDKLILTNNNNKKINNIIDNYDDTVVVDEKKYNKLNSDAQKQIKYMSTVKDQIKTLEKDIKYIDWNEKEETIKTQIVNIRKNINDNTKKIKQIDIDIETNNKLHSNIQISENVKSDIQKCFNKKNVICYEEKFNTILFDLIEQNMDFVKQVHEEEITLLKKKNDYEKIINDLKNDLSNCQNKIKECKKFNKILKRNDQIQKKINEKKILLKEAEKITNDIYCEIYKIDEIKQNYISKDQYDDAVKKTSTIKSDIDVLTTYLKILNVNGICIHIFNIACQQLQYIVNVILKKIGLEYFILIEFDSKTKNDHVIADIDIYKIHNKNKVLATGVSTSEKFFINLSIKIALQKFLNISTPSFLLIDEKFEEVDQTKLKNINDIFESLHESYDKLFIISHLNQVAQHCSNTISIVQENFFSKII